MSHRLPVTRYWIALGIGLLGVIGSIIPFLSEAEESLGLHLLYQMRGPQTPWVDVVLVGIDSQSARALELPLRASKWPRQLHSRLVDRLATAFTRLMESEKA